MTQQSAQYSTCIISSAQRAIESGCRVCPISFLCRRVSPKTIFLRMVLCRKIWFQKWQVCVKVAVSARLREEFLTHIIVNAYTRWVQVEVCYAKKKSRIAILFIHLKNWKMCRTVSEVFVLLVWSSCCISQSFQKPPAKQKHWPIKKRCQILS